MVSVFAKEGQVAVAIRWALGELVLCASEVMAIHGQTAPANMAPAWGTTG